MVVAIAALSGIATFFGVAVRETQHAHRAAEEARLQDTARALASAVDAQLGTYVTSLRALAATAVPFGREQLLESVDDHLGNAARVLGGLIVLTGPPPDFLLSTRDGMGMIDPQRPLRPPAVFNQLRPLMEQAFRERRPVVSHLFHGAITNQPRIAIYTPVIRDGEAAGLLSLGMAPAAFQRILDRQGLVGDVRATLVDDQGHIVALTNFPAPYEVGMTASPTITGAIRGRDRAFLVAPVRDGERRAIALERQTVAPGWFVVVSRLDADLDAVAWHQLRWVQAAGLAFLAMVVLLVWVSRRQARQDAEARAEALEAGRAEIERLHGGLPAMIFLREVSADGTSRRIYRSGDIRGVTGWTAEDVQATHTMAEKSSLGVEGEIQFFRKVLREGSGTTENLLDRPNGPAQWVRITVRVIERRPNGDALVVGYLINVNDEVLAREAARKAQQELERTLSHAPIAVYRAKITATGQVHPLYRSPGFLSVTGWHPETIGDRNIFGFLTPDDPETSRRCVESLRKTGEWRADVEMRRPDGSRFWGRVHSCVLERGSDEAVEVIGYILDITQERLAEESARRVQRLASLGEFSSGVAHELRQPLATMMLAAENAQFALEGNDKADADARLGKIVLEIERASALIERLRQFARGSTGQERVEPVSLGVVIDTAEALVGRSLESAGVTVTRHGPDAEIMVLANRISLEQVIVNLMANARDALEELPPGHDRRISLETRSDTRAGLATLTFIDTGGGILPNVLPRLFEPFVTSKGPDKGTGIGLSICFGLMRSMGGTIEGANSGQGGAVFTLTLRLAPVTEMAGVA